MKQGDHVGPAALQTHDLGFKKLELDRPVRTANGDVSAGLLRLLLSRIQVAMQEVAADVLIGLRRIWVRGRVATRQKDRYQEWGLQIYG